MRPRGSDCGIPDAGHARSILHVEAGPTFGGSTLALQNYLAHADSGLFAHDVLFYSEVPGCNQIRGSCRRFLCLRRPAPANWDQAPTVAPVRSRRRSGLRAALKSVPGLRRLVRGIREAGLFARRELPLSLRIARILRQGRYDLVHCNNTFLVQRAVLMAGWLSRTPVVAHVRTRVEVGALDRRLGNGARRIFAVSRSLADDLSRQGIRAPIVVCYEGTVIGGAGSAVADGACRTGFQSTREAGAGRTLGFAGRLVERKGVRYLLEAMPHVLALHPDVRLEIVGDGPLRGDLEAQGAGRKLDRAVRFVGFRADVPAWLRTIDVFVLPSLTEGLPLVLLEAMAAARPIVACAVDGVPEFVRHEETGLLVARASAAALAEGLVRLLRDPAMAARLGLAAHAFVKAHGDLRVTARKLDAALADALTPMGVRGA